MEIRYGFSTLSAGISEERFPDYQYWLILSGDGRISDEDGAFDLTAQDVFEIPFETTIRIECAGSVQIEVMTVLDFQPGNKVLQKKDHHDTELIRRAFFFAVEFSGLRHEAMGQLRFHLDKLMYEVLASTGLEEYRINPQIAAALDEINRHALEPDYDLNPVIQASGYSRSHFHKLFREPTGLSPVGYLHDKRIDRAKDLLRQSQKLSIAEVAHRCGYTDVYYFSRMFRKLTGVSPTEFAGAG